MIGPRRLCPSLVAAATTLLVAGCGSTLQAHGNSGSELSLTAPSSAPGATAGGSGGLAVPGTGAGPGTAAPGNAGGGPGSGPTAPGSTQLGQPGGPGSSSVRVIPADAPGITATTVWVGFGYSSQAASGDRALGLSGQSPTYDSREVYQAVIDYANKHGGFAGRALKVHWFDYKLTDQNNEDEAACNYWTADNKVFAMFGQSELLRTCAEKAHAISFGAGAEVASTFQKYPHFVDPISIRLDREGQVTVAGLARGGYFGGKLGLVTWDDPNYRFAMEHGYMPALAARHVPVTDHAYIEVPQSADSLAGGMATSVRSAIARFHTEHIDHVIIQDGAAGVWKGTGLTLEWMNESKAQGYYPRYGENSSNAPGWSALPSDEQDHAVAVITDDFDPANDQGWHQNRTRQNCFAIEAAAGLPVNTSNQNDMSQAAEACDTVFFLQRVLNSGLGLVTPDAFIQAVTRLGTSFPSAFVYGTKFFPGRRDGSDMLRGAEYFASCTCLRFAGPPAYAD
jgi:hypothetical protein